MFPKELLDILICPKCGEKLNYSEEKNILYCDACGKVYNIVDDIPILIVDEDENGTTLK